MGKNLTADGTVEGIQDIQEFTDQNRFNRFNSSLKKFLLSHIIYVDHFGSVQIESDWIISIDQSIGRWQNHYLYGAAPLPMLWTIYRFI